MSPMNASCPLRPLRPSQNRPACEQMSPSVVLSNGAKYGPQFIRSCETQPVSNVAVL